MNSILEVGDSICSPLSSYLWVVRSALPGRLRLFNIQYSIFNITLMANCSKALNLQLLIPRMCTLFALMSMLDVLFC